MNRLPAGCRPQVVIALLVALSLAASPPATAEEMPPVSATGHDNHLGLTFSPDGTTAFWVAWNGEWGSEPASQKVIYASRQRDGRWSPPVPAPFSGRYSDDDPFVSPDGRWLYFVSRRPAGDGDAELDADIWRYSLIGDDRLEHLSINSPSAEYSPVVTTSGTLYFASARPGGPGQGDLYRAAPSAGGFEAPEPLGPALNGPAGEWNLWVSPEETEILFEASARPTNVSAPGDLYYSWRTSAGWAAAVPVGELNSTGSDLMPRFSPDGRTVYYTVAPSGGHAQVTAESWPPLRSRLRAGYAPTLLVANRASHEVAFVDLARGEVVTRVATGAGPHLLSNVSEGRVVATGYGEFPAPHAEPVAARPPFVEALNSRLTLIDTASRTALLDTVIDGCVRPHDSLIVGRSIYVTCESERRVLELDIADGRITGRFDTMQEGSHVLSFDPASRTLAVSNTDSGSVTLIDLDSGATRVVELAAGSEGSLSVAGRIWIANAIDGSISVVDPGTATVVRQIDGVCGFPIALAGDARGQVWVACFASAELVAVDRDSLVAGRRIGLGDQPLNLIVHPERDLAYVSLPRQNGVAEIDLASGRELRRIGVGIEPDGLRWALRTPSTGQAPPPGSRTSPTPGGWSSARGARPADFAGERLDRGRSPLHGKAARIDGAVIATARGIHRSPPPGTGQRPARPVRGTACRRPGCRSAGPPPTRRPKRR